MHSFIYTSQANVLFSESELSKLVSVSQHNNFRLGITGYLYFREDQFLQYLEGVEDDLEQIFQRISNDDRHTIVKTIWFGHIQERYFPQWSMRLIDPDESETTQLLEDILIDMMQNQDELGFENEDILKTIERLKILQK